MKNIVAFSGGKDSTALLLMMIEKNMPIDEIVFADTLLEFPEMYKYIEDVEKHIDRKIIKISPKTTFFKWFYGLSTKGKYKGIERGFPPQKCHCYWSREVKEYCLKKYTHNNNVYIGIASDEKKRAKKHPKFNAIYPLVDWNITEKECINYLKSKNLENPLYEVFDRTGCWLCPKQKINSLRVLYKKYPLYWRTIKIMEQETKGCKFRTDYSVDELEQKFIKEKEQAMLNLKV